MILFGCLLLSLYFGGHVLSFIWDDALIGGVIQVQNLGVVIFFILSGYLICRTFQKYNCFRDFFIDRFSRIYLTLVPCLILISIIDFFVKDFGMYRHEAAFGFNVFVANLFMLQDHPFLWLVNRIFNVDVQVTSFGSARPLWTLAVEWWIYMFAGWFFLSNRKNIVVFLFLAIVPVAFSTFGRGQGLTLFWMLGAAMIFLPRSDALKKKWVEISIIVFCILYLMRMLQVRDFYDMQANLFLACIFGSFLILSRKSVLFSPLPKMLKSMIKVLAGASYALYILHYTIIELFGSLKLNGANVILYSVVVSNLLAIAVYLVFDRNHKKFGIFVRKLFNVPTRETPARTT